MTKIALYVRTYSATTRHIINPDAPEKTLCGSRCMLPELFIGDAGAAAITEAWMVYGLPACGRCDKSAAKREILADTRERDVEIAAQEARTMNVEETPVVIAVESGDKVTKDGLKGRVLEVCTRAGVMLAAVAFGFALVWVKVAELVAL